MLSSSFNVPSSCPPIYHAPTNYALVNHRLAPFDVTKKRKREENETEIIVKKKEIECTKKIEKVINEEKKEEKVINVEKEVMNPDIITIVWKLNILYLKRIIKLYLKKTLTKSAKNEYKMILRTCDDKLVVEKRKTF